MAFTSINLRNIEYSLKPCWSNVPAKTFLTGLFLMSQSRKQNLNKVQQKFEARESTINLIVYIKIKIYIISVYWN